jgi:hypothetical protein
MRKIEVLSLGKKLVDTPPILTNKLEMMVCTTSGRGRGRKIVL